MSRSSARRSSQWNSFPPYPSVLGVPKIAQFNRARLDLENPFSPISNTPANNQLHAEFPTFSPPKTIKIAHFANAGTAIVASIFLSGFALAGCTTWGYKSRTGNLYPRTDWQTVKVLWRPPPAATYEEVGMCSVLGGAAFITSDVDMFNKLRKAAADLGADAVIVMREGSSRATWASGSYGGFLSASSWSSDYPRNFGIAIKWLKRS